MKAARVRQTSRVVSYAALLVLVLDIASAHAGSPPLAPVQQAVQQQALTDYNNGDYQAALPLLTALAATGDARAETDLGSMYYHGLGVQEDNKRGLDLLNRAVNQNDGQAEYRLGFIHLDNGDTGKSFPLFSAAASQGDQQGQQYVALSYQNGWGVPQDETKGVMLLQHYAAVGNSWAADSLGDDYSDGDGVPRDYAQAMSWYKQATNGTCGCAETNIGYLYYHGLGVPVDYTQAFHWYLQGANLGNPYAEDGAADMYLYGQGVAPDSDKASYWYRKAVNKGNYGAAYDLGDLYYHGTHIPQDYGLARQYLLLAAAHGNVHAEYILGNIYYWGDGVGKDAGISGQYYGMASERGEENAQVDLAYQYETGQGVPQSYEKDFILALITRSLIHGPALITNDNTADDLRLTQIHMQIDLPHLSQSDVEDARSQAKAWLAYRGAQYDPALDTIDAPPRSPTYRLLIGAVLLIALLYGAAKIAQARLKR